MNHSVHVCVCFSAWSSTHDDHIVNLYVQSLLLCWTMRYGALTENLGTIIEKYVTKICTKSILKSLAFCELNYLSQSGKCLQRKIRFPVYYCCNT